VGRHAEAVGLHWVQLSVAGLVVTLAAPLVAPIGWATARTRLRNAAFSSRLTSCFCGGYGLGGTTGSDALISLFRMTSP
jgi:hypothetical protein